MPEWPFQRVCTDYFHSMEQDYLTNVDRFSGWPCDHHFKVGTMNSMKLTNICKDLFPMVSQSSLVLLVGHSLRYKYSNNFYRTGE